MLRDGGSGSLLRVVGTAAPPRARLVAVPYAGGGATVFHGWRDSLPVGVETCVVQLPGRQDRWQEKALTRVDEIADRTAAEVGSRPHALTVLYGHSFGALVAFEVARRLQANGHPAESLVVGARGAPQLPYTESPIHDASEHALVEALGERYGAPIAALQNPELLRLALVGLRGDLEALETYRYVEGEPLKTSVTVLRGRQDASLSEADALAWRRVTAGGFAIHEIEAGHFFLHSHRFWVLDQIADQFGRLL